jgi:hypothetical protein
MMPLHQCPCCDYFTLEERAIWDICEVCYWEDDGHDLDRRDDPSGCNKGLTLRQGRDNFRRLGACEPEMIQYVCPAEERGRYAYAQRT